MKIWNYKSNKDDKISKQLEKDPNICYTTDKMAKHLISLITFNDNDIVMEPCKGKGAFYNNLPSNVVKKYCEINENIDYLLFNDKVDITLSNPPFTPRKLFWDFMIKAMDTTNKEIYWLINISALNVFTPVRLTQMKNKGWYMQNMHIVNDKRWFGRYVWCKFSKIENNILSFCSTTF